MCSRGVYRRLGMCSLLTYVHSVPLSWESGAQLSRVCGGASNRFAVSDGSAVRTAWTLPIAASFPLRSSALVSGQHPS